MALRSLLAHHIRQHGPIPSARVSSAQSRGNAKKYSYWGAVRYEIRLTGKGAVSNIALERASSDRRSERLVERDCDGLCEREGRVRMQHIGPLSEAHCETVLGAIDSLAGAVRTHISRRPANQPPPLTLAERLLVRLAKKYWRAAPSDETVAQQTRDKILRRKGRWLIYRWQPVAYIPHGDARDIEEFRLARNQEQRRMIHAACGERVTGIDAMTAIHRDDYGTLYDTGLGGRVVRVVCPSTGAVYMLPVSWRPKTAHAAVAETFGLDETEYRPLAEA